MKVTDSNRDDTIRSYAHAILEDMDDNCLYTLAYEFIIDSKNPLSNQDLEAEISSRYPDILEDLA